MIFTIHCFKYFTCRNRSNSSDFYC